MTKLKVRRLKWQKLKVRGTVLDFCLKPTKITNTLKKKPSINQNKKNNF